MAGDVEVVSAELVAQGAAWQVNVTLRHADTGWDHYADAWRLVSPGGDMLGTRTLLHPHVDEQPFVRSGGPDLMILDILMPDMDGYEVLGELRAFSELPVIAVSASISNSAKALEAGANYFFAKPFRASEIVPKMNEYLEG